MDCFGVYNTIRSECTYLVRSLCASFTSLFGLFQKTVHVEPHSTLVLEPSRIKISGIENAGNSCILSVFLQELAALPEVYAVFLTTPLQKREGESDYAFAKRKELQQILIECTNTLNAGDLVKKSDVCRLSKVLVQLGWQAETTSFWRRFLHKLAPQLFSLPLSNPHQLFDKFFSIFSEVHSPYQIALLARTSPVSLEQIIKQTSSINNEHDDILWRVVEDSEVEQSLKEKFQLGNRLFRLKVVHIVQKTSTGNHVMMYQKIEDQWIGCNDATVYKVSTLPTKNIYAGIYASHILS